MKVVILVTCDTLLEHLHHAARVPILDLDDDAREAAEAHQLDVLKALSRRWFTRRDCVDHLRVELDTDAMTCTVLPSASE